MTNRQRIDPLWQCAENGGEDAVFGGTTRCREHVGPGDGWIDGRFLTPLDAIEYVEWARERSWREAER